MTIRYILGTIFVAFIALGSFWTVHKIWAGDGKASQTELHAATVSEAGSVTVPVLPTISKKTKIPVSWQKKTKLDLGDDIATVKRELDGIVYRLKSAEKHYESGAMIEAMEIASAAMANIKLLHQFSVFAEKYGTVDQQKECLLNILFVLNSVGELMAKIITKCKAETEKYIAQEWQFGLRFGVARSSVEVLTWSDLWYSFKVSKIMVQNMMTWMDVFKGYKQFRDQSEFTKALEACKKTTTMLFRALDEISGLRSAYIVKKV